MAQASRQEEYWRPPNATVIRLAEPGGEEVPCPNCGMRFLIGARFCYICGSSRKLKPAAAPVEPLSGTDLVDLSLVRRRLGLSIPSLIFFIVGIGCLLAALVIRFLYKVDTAADWQSIHLWRIEWLLAACASLLAAVLLKSCRNND